MVVDADAIVWDENDDGPRWQHVRAGMLDSYDFC